MDISERDYLTLEAAPVDGTDEPEAENVPGPINVVSDEIEVATEEDLRRIIEEEGKVGEPEIGAYELEDPAPSPVRRGRSAGLDRTSLITQRTSTSARTWRAP